MKSKQEIVYMMRVKKKRKKKNIEITITFGVNDWWKSEVRKTRRLRSLWAFYNRFSSLHEYPDLYSTHSNPSCSSISGRETTGPDSIRNGIWLTFAYATTVYNL